MENITVKQASKLLPNYFKMIGFIAIILALIILTTVAIADIELMRSQKILARIITTDALILGLFFIAFSKDKIEDEMTFHIRLKSMAWTFAWAIIYVVVKPITDSILNYSSYFKTQLHNLDAVELIMSMLMCYLINYYFQKYRR